ncbi:outer membrane lipoprotein-sorting protein [Roseimarinus sediminis]|jgi:outer membrane lipoprotein-sorting protein|uniref:outer membrane lipoprotein-sorting protein n=1 Tax=Roseimarinus sediminis TaxID=1610899 RepID=UPI003D2363E7
MKTILLLLLVVQAAMGQPAVDADVLLEKVDRNLSSENRVMESTTVIHGKRISRTLTSKSYVVGDRQSFTEYLSPAREQGTKMLKLEDQLWIYSPSTDRTIQIAGHMLRQSVMGSDMSYEDMMDDRKLTETYNATVESNTVLDGRDVYLIRLDAKVNDVAYPVQKMWVDAERFVPLKQEMYAKSGQLLKRMTMKDVKKIDGRWFPHSMVYKDMLKDGDGTEMIINSIQFNVEIPDYLFSKAALKQ